MCSMRQVLVWRLQDPQPGCICVGIGNGLPATGTEERLGLQAQLAWEKRQAGEVPAVVAPSLVLIVSNDLAEC